MRILGVGDYCELGALYMRLLEDGHDVKVYIAEPLCHGTLAGIVGRTEDWRTELQWVKAAGPEGLILFENVSHDRGVLQDDLRAEGYNVIGGSAFGDKLENDRAYALGVLEDLGMARCNVWEFAHRQEALRFLAERPDRYVLKFNGPTASINNYVGRLPDGRDLQALIGSLPATETTPFVLMNYLEGIEMGVGAYFNGDDFITPACLDWEHKRFFPGDLGELTGEMGTVVTYENTARFFELTLKRVEPLLREHRYCGYINLNTIVNEDGIWPLEFTCRFGYPGFAILDPLQTTNWADLFQVMVSRSAASFATEPGFAVGIVMTTPPFPYQRPYVPEPIGVPILFHEVSDEQRRHLHYGEVGLDRGHLVTTGIWGWTMVVTGTGSTIASAQAAANRLADRVIIPNARYRRDIGQRLIDSDLQRLEGLGVFRSGGL